MGIKLIVGAALFVLAALENGCQAKKGGGGPMGGFGGFGGFGSSPALQLRFQLIQTHMQCQNALNATNTTIQDKITTAQNTIGEELKASQDRVKTVSSSSPNAAQCATAHTASLAAVNSEEVKNCDQAMQLQAVQFQLLGLYRMHGQLGMMNGMCSPWMMTDPTMCSTISEGIAKQITDQRDGILEALANVEKAADTDIQTVTQNAHAAISNADKAFDDCVAQSSA